jgi:hypothetical protein
MLGIIRCKMSNFIGLCKDEIFVYLKSTVKQTIVEYISQLDDDSNPNQDDENNLRLIDQVKQLKIQEFLHLLSRVLTNVRTMLSRVKVNPFNFIRFILIKNFLIHFYLVNYYSFNLCIKFCF